MENKRLFFCMENKRLFFLFFYGNFRGRKAIILFWENMNLQVVLQKNDQD